MTSFVRSIETAIAVAAVFLVLQGTAVATCGGQTCCVVCPGTSLCNAPSGCNGCSTTCVICGTANTETINGTSGKDLICGEDGDDVIDGKGNDDTIYGGAGTNTIYGGAGSDWLWGSYGDDAIYGEDGNDHIDGGGGSDLLSGGPGTDTITQNIPVERKQPRDFVENLVNDFYYSASIYTTLPPNVHSTLGSVSTLTANVCGTNVTAPGVGSASSVYILNDPNRTRLLLSPSNEVIFGGLAGLGAEVQFVAPATGKYAFAGNFARVSACGTTGDGVIATITPGTFSDTIGPTDFNDHPFSVSPTLLNAGDTMIFSVVPGTALDPTNDITEFELTVTPYDVDGHQIAETLPSILCGGSGNNDVLVASGPGHVCFDGGAGTGDTCTYNDFSVPAISDRDVATATSSCETPNGTSATRHPFCGCD